MIAQPTYINNFAAVGYVPPVSAPDGYVTSDEFRERAIEKVDKFCDKYGIL